MSRPDPRCRPQRPANPVDLNQRYTIPEACGYLATSHTSLYARILAKELAVIREGKRVFIPGSEIARLSQQPEKAHAA